MESSFFQSGLGNVNKGDQSGWGWRKTGDEGHWRHKGPKEVNMDVRKGPRTASQRFQTPRKPRLTHFISLPLGIIPGVRMAVSAFTSALLAQSLPIRGLDESIVIPARRLHMTLGVMSLADDEVRDSARNSNANAPVNPKTVTASVSLLQSLRPRILDALGDAPLCVPLTCIDIMKPEKGDIERAHVMFAGPSEDHASSETARTLRRVCELVNREFIISGLAVDENRPLKLHCTLLNTSSRKNQPKNGRRTPFSFNDVLASEAFKKISETPIASPFAPSSKNITSNRLQATSISAEIGGRTGNGTTHDNLWPATADTRQTRTLSSSRNMPWVARPVITSGEPAVDDAVNQRLHGHRVHLGTYAVTEIQICVMGSHGSDNEYVCVGKIDL